MSEKKTQTVFVVETRPKGPLPEGAKKYIRDVPLISTVIHKGVGPEEAARPDPAAEVRDD